MPRRHPPAQEAVVDIRQILLLQPAEKGWEAQTEFAARLAKSHGASVAGVCLYAEPDPTPADCFAEGAVAIADVLDRHRSQVAQICAPLETSFRRAIAGHGLSDGWEAGDVNVWRDQGPALERARLADLVIAPALGADADWRGLIEALVLQSGAPCLLTPANVRPCAFSHIVLAWNGSREAKRAMDDALPFLKAASDVVVVTIDDDETRRVEASESEALVRHLARHGVGAEALRRPASKGAGEVLMDACEAAGADLLVMGAYGRSRAAEFILGGATRTILSHARTPTLLSH
jgi:nucleotide-binding universal stress UspA family protein